MADEIRTGAGAASPAQRRGGTAGVGLFFRQILDELRKVVRPTRSEWVNYTTLVMVFVITIMLLVFGLDSLFTRLVAWAFGSN